MNALTFTRLVLASSYSFILALAGAMGEGSPCTPTNDHLDPLSHKFLSDCTTRTFCSPPSSPNGNWTCVPRLCRRDEYPFGYPFDVILPPMCAEGRFCPDQGSGCLQKLPLGSKCQMGRDEQCSSEDVVLCLKETCVSATASLGDPCLRDETTYIEPGVNGQQFSNIIVRDSCHAPSFFCDPATNTCVQSKPLGAECSHDAECQTRLCITNRCITSPTDPINVPAWQYTLTIACIISAMAATTVAITMVHRRHRYRNYIETRDYYFEQISLRRSIIAMHAAAVDKGNKGMSKKA
ncbi:hypothetical protein DL96DRAFT_1620171 [Flagelloscypha sp. PMI_526]|nr:hypothetical protein DL96DRAFT_1620171 [Flagelloscypha sp. PMI_526]